MHIMLIIKCISEKHSNPAQEFLHHEVALMLIFPWRIQKHRPQHCFTHDHTCDEITAYSKITHYNIISPHSCSVSHVMYYVNYNAMHFVSYERWKALSVKALIMSLLVCMASCLGETGWCHTMSSYTCGTFKTEHVLYQNQTQIFLSWQTEWNSCNLFLPLVIF